MLLVLDCGGGTVDITVHKLQCDVHERFLSQELLPSSGGQEWGSKYVDFYFEEFLGEFLRYEIRVGEALVTADIPHARGQEPIAAGTPVALAVPASELRFVSA